jgi:CheY-like chemotaxis protein
MDRCIPSDSLRVLAVDDDADTRETIALLVRLQGHDARTASDGPTALAMAVRYLPNVILLDVAMPGMSGGAVAESLRGDPERLHRRRHRVCPRYGSATFTGRRLRRPLGQTVRRGPTRTPAGVLTGQAEQMKRGRAVARTVSHCP